MSGDGVQRAGASGREIVHCGHSRARFEQFRAQPRAYEPGSAGDYRVRENHAAPDTRAAPR
ncbi:hypothetical protein GCM10027360_02790 [Amycolatopsis echigonensis]